MKNAAGAVGFLTGLLICHGVPADDWVVDYDASHLGFVATYDEIPFEGRFRNFDARIRFNPDTPTEGSFIVTIDISSVDTNSPDRDEGMLETEWFDAERFPDASFDSTRFERRPGEDEYTVAGDLTIKGVTKSVTASFRWTRTGDTAQLKGSTDVRRGDFDIGAGDWADDDTIGFDVGIEFDLTLVK